MQPQVKRYYVVIQGRVLDVGYRKRIESAAELFGIKGFPWNDVDGSVKIVCEGREDFLNRFLGDIEIKEELPSGIFVESLEKKEVSIEFPLPPRFARLEIEGLAEISRKLDTGNERLKNIEANAEVMIETLKSIDLKLGTLPEKIADAVRRGE